VLEVSLYFLRNYEIYVPTCTFILRSKRFCYRTIEGQQSTCCLIELAAYKVLLPRTRSKG
jgi:hypothetical protein